MKNEINNNVEELRPRIRPKAPAALKANVLKAVSQDSLHDNRQPRRSSRRAMAWQIPLAAAAVLLFGILTFALRGVDGNSESLLVATTPHTSPQEEGTASRAIAAPSSLEGGTAGATYSAKDAVAIGGLQKSRKAEKQGSMAAEKRRSMTAEKQGSMTAEKQRSAAASAEPSQALQAEEHTTPLPHREGQGESRLLPFEHQLLADFEAHRDLVNACLAEELAQVRFTQQRIDQSTRQYLQQYHELQQRITEQLREDIEGIAPEKNNPKEV